MDGAVERSREVADELFERYAAVFGPDLSIYRGDVQRVLGLVGLQRTVRWTSPGGSGWRRRATMPPVVRGTWDYVLLSMRRATAALDGPDRAYTGLVYAGLVPEMIDEHHRLRHICGSAPLVEAFRRADLADVSRASCVRPGCCARPTGLCASRTPRMACPCCRAASVAAPGRLRSGLCG